jgi:U3 small nucleolar RNA-associated protein 14
MARRDEELRRRKEGRAGAGDDESETSSEGSSNEESEGALRRELDALEQESEGEGRSRLDNLKFMRTAAARKRAEENELLRGIRRTLDGEDAADLEETEVTEVGRRQYGTDSNKKPFAPALKTSSREAPEPMDEDDDHEVDIKTNTKAPPTSGQASWSSAPRSEAETKASSSADKKGNWTLADPRRKRKHDSSLTKSTLLDTTALSARQPNTTTLSNSDSDTSASDSETETFQSNPKSSKSRTSRSALLARAFAGDTAVEEDFAREKADITREEDDKVVDNTLPGWGSWVGEGVSQRDRARNKGRFVTKVEGVKAKDRKDAKLDRVIMNEKHAKKVYLPNFPTPLPIHLQVY